MQAHNTTVPPADTGALLDSACTFGTASSDSSFAFLTMCELSLLVHKLQRTCCTLGSIHRNSSARADDVMELYKSSERLLEKWQGHMSGISERTTGVGTCLIGIITSSPKPHAHNQAQCSSTYSASDACFCASNSNSDTACLHLLTQIHPIWSHSPNWSTLFRFSTRKTSMGTG